MVQWFPDKRGLATGLVAAGYGVGALLTTFPIAAVLRESSYQTALTRFGFIFAGVGRPRGAGTSATGRHRAHGMESSEARGRPGGHHQGRRAVADARARRSSG